MARAIITTCCLLGGVLLGPVAAARAGIDLQVERSFSGFDARAADRNAATHAGLMRRWIPVGKCVVGYDRSTSLALVRARIGSDDASEAARRLDPIFATCLAGSGAPGPSSVVLRRAALATALGIALPARLT